MESPKKSLQELLQEQQELDRLIEDFKKKGVTPDLQPQIQALHEYNEMKDLCQVILGYLADAEQISVKDLHLKYGLPIDQN